MLCSTEDELLHDILIVLISFLITRGLLTLRHNTSNELIISVVEVWL